MTLATILFCLLGQPLHCPVQKQVRIERRACGIGPIRAQVPYEGHWHDAVVRVRCGRGQ